MYVPANSRVAWASKTLSFKIAVSCLNLSTSFLLVLKFHGEIGFFVMIPSSLNLLPLLLLIFGKSLMMNSQPTVLSPPLLSAMVLPLPFGSIIG
jgi:hypothetical protein